MREKLVLMSVPFIYFYMKNLHTHMLNHINCRGKSYKVLIEVKKIICINFVIFKLKNKVRNKTNMIYGNDNGEDFNLIVIVII